MPIVNGRYYMNEQYGRGLESARAADDPRGDEEPSWLDLFLGLVPTAEEQARSNQTGNKSDKLQEQPKAADRSERAAMSYSEKTDGTMEEHEAMQSTVMNRVASQQKQYVAPGQSVSEYNVIFAPNQYQGVTDPKAPPDSSFSRYLNGANNPGARNAAQADANLKRSGKPTTDATFFIVNPSGRPPSPAQVHRLGKVVPANPSVVGHVYLYKTKPPVRR